MGFSLGGFSGGVAAGRDRQDELRSKKMDTMLRGAALANEVEKGERESRNARIKSAQDRLDTMAREQGKMLWEQYKEAPFSPELEGHVTQLVTAWEQQYSGLADAMVRSLGADGQFLDTTGPRNLFRSAAPKFTKAPAEEAMGQPVPIVRDDGTETMVRYGNKGSSVDVGVTAPKADKNVQLVQAFDNENKTTLWITPEQALNGGGRYKPLGNGLSLEVNKDGTFKFVSGDQAGGGAASGQLGQTGQNKVDDQLLAATAAYGRLSKIASSVRPEFLQARTQLDAWTTAMKERAGLGVTPEQKQLLADFTTFKQDTITNLTQVIKDATGASMGREEAARIEAGAPNTEDSATQFFTKLNNTQAEIAKAVARLAYAKQNGLSITAVPLSDMPRIMRERAHQIAADLQGAGTADDQLATETQLRLAREFGLVPP